MVSNIKLMIFCFVLFFNTVSSRQMLECITKKPKFFDFFFVFPTKAKALLLVRQRQTYAMLVMSMAQLPTALVTLISSVWRKPSSTRRHLWTHWQGRRSILRMNSVDVAAERCHMPRWRFGEGLLAAWCRRTGGCWPCWQGSGQTPPELPPHLSARPPAGRSASPPGYPKLRTPGTFGRDGRIFNHGVQNIKTGEQTFYW